MSGHTAIIGSRHTGGPVYIYVQGPSGWPSTPSATLPDPITTGSDGFGDSVSVSATTAVVGAQYTASGGIAYVYIKGKAGWPTSPSVELPDPTTGTFNGFAHSVAVERSTIVVGAPQANNGNGIAYVYAKRAGHWPTTPTATLADPGVSVIDNFGDSVAVSGHSVLVGAPGTNLFEGAAYLYVKSGSRWPMRPIATLPGPGTADGDMFNFGWSLSISGTTALVGSPGTDQSEGETYIYVKGHKRWSPVPTASLTDPSGKVNDHFGFSVAVAGTTIVVGAWGTDAENGEAYIYAKGRQGWPTTATAGVRGATSGMQLPHRDASSSSAPQMG